MMTIQQADRQLGFDDGFGKGFDDGFGEGVEQNRRQTVLNMLEMNMTPTDIARASNWPIEEILRLQKNKTLIEEEA